MARKRLPKPHVQGVRFQTSQRGVHFPSLAAARRDFEAWLDTGESPAGAETSVHIWQNKRERIVDRIGDDPRGETLRAFLKRSLRNGRLQIRETRKNRA
jgi:hypothetical protein